MSEPVFDHITQEILKQRYLQEGETPIQMFRRVADFVASAEAPALQNHWADRFYEEIYTQRFMPSTPVLMNAGVKHRKSMLMACFVLQLDDNMSAIMDTVKDTAMIHKFGGGTGMSYGRTRPQGWAVSSTQGIASGPVSWMQVINAVTEVIKQGGTRRGANFGSLPITHPDILRFISCKETEGDLQNINISVSVTDGYIKQLLLDPQAPFVTTWDSESYYLRPDGTSFSIQEGSTGAMTVAQIWETLCTHSWANGEPGIQFIDTINDVNPLPQLGRIESANACGEIPQANYTSCCLGSVNLAKCVLTDSESSQPLKKINYVSLRQAVEIGIRFLDDVLDVNHYPLEKIKEVTLAGRGVGLGIMGFADMLIILGVKYGSDESFEVASTVMKFIEKVSVEYSAALGLEKGIFPCHREGQPRVRNAFTNALAPTGTTSKIANCNFGLEPFFSWKYERHILDSTFIEKPAVVQEFEKVHPGEPLPEYFVTATQVSPAQHVEMVARFQKYTSSGASKTVNLPRAATVEDVSEVFLLAHKRLCKSITVYRQGSRNQAVIVPVHEKEESVDTTKARPALLTGKVFKEKVALNDTLENVYVTVGELDGKPYEIFMEAQSDPAWTPVLTRLVSLCLRYDIPIEQICKQLFKVKRAGLHDLPKVIARLLLRRYVEEQTPLDLQCPECQKVMINFEGCPYCPHCGFSACT